MIISQAIAVQPETVIGPGSIQRRRKMKTSIVAVATLCALVAPAYAAKSIKVTMNAISADGVGKAVGTITIKEGKEGVTLEPKLKDLPPGEHGFHVHEKPSCDPADKDGKKTAGQAAGAHYDPDGTKAHKGPGGGGHKGDLPKLVVSDKGEAKDKMEMKGATLADFQGRALVIHAGGDNYSDTPKPLGGGGDRIACGVVK
jgi:superoxide dismutase, Cu-Zn family